MNENTPFTTGVAMYVHDLETRLLTATRERDEAVRERDGCKALVTDLLPHVSLAILPGPLDARLVQFVDSLTTDKAAQE